MKKLPEGWFSKGLNSAKQEVAAWPDWKRVAMQVSSSQKNVSKVLKERNLSTKSDVSSLKK